MTYLPLCLITLSCCAGADRAHALGLRYGRDRCSVEVEPVDDRKLLIRLRSNGVSGLPVEAHLTLIPRMDKPFAAERLTEQKLRAEPINLTPEQAGGWISHNGWRLSLPDDARVDWPALPHNPYRKDGAARPEEGRIVVSVPMHVPSSAEGPSGVSEQVLTLSIED